MLKKNFAVELFVRKKSLFIVLSLIVLFSLAISTLAPACWKAAISYREDAVLLELIRSAGAELKSVNVTGWVRVGDKAPGALDPQALANKVAALMDLPDAGSRVASWQNQYAHGVKIEGMMPDGCAVTVLAQEMELSEGEKGSHVMVGVAGAENRKTRFYKQKIYKALNPYGGETRLAVTYSGKIENELSQEELLAGAEKVMAFAGAPVLEKTVKDNLVSMTGFSRRFSSGMYYSGKDINVNVALRSNPVEHTTYVYVASPVIFTEY